MLAIYTAEQDNRFMTTTMGLRVAKIRKSLGFSQGGFSKALGIGLGTIHDWEQGNKTPSGPAMALLRVLEANPQAVLKALDSNPAVKGRKHGKRV